VFPFATEASFGLGDLLSSFTKDFISRNYCFRSNVCRLGGALYGIILVQWF
jgi:hypothetical protein